jgi:hypothetical protein
MSIDVEVPSFSDHNHQNFVPNRLSLLDLLALTRSSGLLLGRKIGFWHGPVIARKPVDSRKSLSLRRLARLDIGKPFQLKAADLACKIDHWVCLDEYRTTLCVAR